MILERTEHWCEREVGVEEWKKEAPVLCRWPETAD